MRLRSGLTTSLAHALQAATTALCLTAAAVSAQDDVPFVTSPDAVTLAMLELARVTSDDHVVDLGSGDGRIVITAARRFGASGLGVEIVPDLVALSRRRARAAGVDERVQFREQDLFATDLAAATVVTMYLLPDVNLQLRPRLLALAPGTRIVSHDWDLGDWSPDRTITVDVPDKAFGRDKFSRVHLWIVPARVDGRWCADGASLDVVQRFQRFSATLATAGSAAPARVFDGRIEASTLRSDGLHALTLRLEGDMLHLLDGPGSTPTRRFQRAPGGVCR
ncbi:MAG TPA: methyltransferase domain-containing protein [Caldimonas sp.]|nr:methyltransferase domain-containing protein [Caldimonas sp.]